MYHNLLQFKDFNFVKGEWGKDLCIVTVSCWLHAVCIKKPEKREVSQTLFWQDCRNKLVCVVYKFSEKFQPLSQYNRPSLINSSI